MSRAVLLSENCDKLLPSVSSFLARRCLAALVDSAAVGALSAVLCAAIYRAFPMNPFLHTLNFSMCLGGAFAIGFFDSLFSFGLILTLVMVPCLYFLRLFGPYPNSLGLSVLLLPEAFPLYLWFASHVVANWLYHAHFESSNSKFTLGMRIMNLKVGNAAGRQISFIRATFRHVLKTLTLLATALPIAHVIFGNGMQSIHDRIARCYVFPASKPALLEMEALASLQKPSEFSGELRENRNGDQLLTSHMVEYASLQRRVGAALLDALLFYSLVSTISAVCMSLVYESFAVFISGNDMLIGAVILASAFVYISASLSVSASMAFVEGSRWQATPGKIVFGLKVVSLNGDPIGRIEAFYKQIVQMLVYTSLITLVLIPSILVFLQFSALDDRRNWIGLLFWGFFYCVYGTLMCATLINGRQTVVDRLSKRYVLLDRKRSLVIE